MPVAVLGLMINGCVQENKGITFEYGKLGSGKGQGQE